MIALICQNESDELIRAARSAGDLADALVLVRVPPDGRLLCPPGMRAINRVIELDLGKLEGPAPSDADAVYYDIWRALLSALLAHPDLVGQPGPLSLASRAGGLPEQWMEFKARHPEATVPDYYFGVRAALPEALAAADDVFYSDPECLYYWGAGAPLNPAWKTAAYPFVVRKPPGKPAVVTVSLGQARATRLDGEPLAAELQAWLESASLAMAERWQAQVSEFLYFCAGDGATFAMHSPALRISARLPGFDEFVQSSLRCAIG